MNVSITTVCETIAADYDANYTTCLSGSPTSMDCLLIRMCVQCPRALYWDPLNPPCGSRENPTAEE